MEVEVLSDVVNQTILRLPGRRHPGVVVQGDAMEQLNSLAKRVHRAIEQHDLKAAEDASVELAELLDGYA